MDEFKTVQLTQGAVAKVSPEDFEMVSQHTWHVTTNGYAARTERSTNHRIYMHRFINHTPAGMHTDHIDGNKLNNVRSNLRTATVQEHQGNRSKTSAPTSSSFKGVSFRPPRGSSTVGCWAAYIKVGGEKRHLGHYVTEWDAAWRYNIEAQKEFGEFAKPNDLPLDFLASKPGPTVFISPKYSQYRGVTWSKQQEAWVAYVAVKGKRVHTSFHSTELEAAVAFNAAAVQHHGPSAKLNQL